MAWCGSRAEILVTDQQKQISSQDFHVWLFLCSSTHTWVMLLWNIVFPVLIRPWLEDGGGKRSKVSERSSSALVWKESDWILQKTRRWGIFLPSEKRNTFVSWKGLWICLHFLCICKPECKYWKKFGYSTKYFSVSWALQPPFFNFLWIHNFVLRQKDIDIKLFRIAIP